MTATCGHKTLTATRFYWQDFNDHARPLSGSKKQPKGDIKMKTIQKVSIADCDGGGWQYVVCENNNINDDAVWCDTIEEAEDLLTEQAGIEDYYGEDI